MNLNSSLKRTIKNLPMGPRVASTLGFGGARLKALRLIPKGGVGAEIGVHLGDFSQCILDITRLRELSPERMGL